MADLKIKIGAVTHGLKKGLSDASGSIKRFASSTTALVGGALLSAFAALSVKMTQLAADFETTNVAFKTMMGSAERATALLGELTDLSTKTPFEPAELFKAAKVLLAFGMQADEVTATIKKLGDVSSATGKDISELAKIYGKVFVKGKIQAEELNQLSEAGVPIIKELQKQYGLTAEEIFKLGSKGKLSFQDLDKSINAMTESGGIFFDAMVNQSETLNGKISTLKGNVDLLGQALGDLDISKGIIDKLNSLVKLLQETAVTANDVDLLAESFGLAIEEIISGESISLAEQDKRLGLSDTIGQKQINELRKKTFADKRIKAEQAEQEEQLKQEAAARIKSRDNAKKIGTVKTITDSALSVGQALTPLAALSTNPMLTEAQKQTGLLETIANKTISAADANVNSISNAFTDGA